MREYIPANDRYEALRQIEAQLHLSHAILLTG